MDLLLAGKKNNKRAEGAAECEVEKAEAEAEKAERDRVFFEMAEAEKTKIEANKELLLEKLGPWLEKKKKKKKKKKIELARQIELQKADMEHAKSKDRTAHARDIKFPYFYESKDKMDSYLSRFEKYATANNWDMTSVRHIFMHY